MISSIISRVVILVFGTLYPAYASYKAVRTKNVKEYVKWMMYWIVFALFTCAETFTDVFFSWFPFYYEVKILLVLWLLSPATKGSSILYRKFVHPALCRREQEIDEYILKAKDQGYHTVLNLGTKGVNYATNVIMQTALKGGGGLVQQLRKSYSLSDLTSEDHQDGQQAQLMQEAQDTVTDARLLRRSVSSRRAPPARVDMLFPEVDTARSTRGRESANLAHIRSSEDISSAYAPDGSSIQEVLTRTTSVGGVSRTRSKVTRSTFTSIKRPAAAEDGEIIIEEFDDEDVPQYILDNPTDFDLPTDSNQSNQSSSGAVCLPYSKNIIDQYLRLIMHENLQQSQTEDATDLNYKKYLELKKIFDSNENLSKKKDVKPDEPEEEKRSGEEKKTSNLDSSKDAPCLDPSKDAVIVEPSKNSPLSKKSNNAPLTEPSKDASFSETSKATPFIHVSEIKTKIEEEREMKGDSDLEKPAFLDQSKTISEESRSIGASSSNLSSDDEDEIDFTTPNSSPILKQKSNKGGKYKKRHAPPPPKDITSSQSDRNESDKDTNNCEKEGTKISLPEEKQDRVSPIRATLVLKPGVVKEIGPSVDSSGKYTEVFVSHSPIKRRHRQKNRSPARKSVSSSPISKLMHLPAKFAFWNKNDESVEGSSNRSNSVSSSIINDDESNESNTNDDNSLMSDFGSSVDMKSLSESDTVCVETEKTPKTNVVSEKSSKIIDSEDDQIFEDADENAGEGKEIKKDEAVKVEIKIDGGKENVREVQEMKFNPLSSDYVHIPLKLETLAIHTESRSTDV